MTLAHIIANLPANMHPFDRKEYIKTCEDIIAIEDSKINVHMLGPLRNYAFRIITPYVLDCAHMIKPNNIQ